MLFRAALTTDADFSLESFEVVQCSEKVTVIDIQ